MLIHLISREFALAGRCAFAIADPRALQLGDAGHPQCHALMTLHTVGQPNSELIVQRGAFGAEGGVSHRETYSLHTRKLCTAALGGMLACAMTATT
jgi:hypothetical protein